MVRHAMTHYLKVTPLTHRVTPFTYKVTLLESKVRWTYTNFIVRRSYTRLTILNMEHKKIDKKLLLTLWPNIMVLAVSPRWRGDGPIVITNDVLAVPTMQKMPQKTHST